MLNKLKLNKKAVILLLCGSMTVVNGGPLFMVPEYKVQAMTEREKAERCKEFLNSYFGGITCENMKCGGNTLKFNGLSSNSVEQSRYLGILVDMIEDKVPNFCNLVQKMKRDKNVHLMRLMKRYKWICYSALDRYLASLDLANADAGRDRDMIYAVLEVLGCQECVQLLAQNFGPSEGTIDVDQMQWPDLAEDRRQQIKASSQVIFQAKMDRERIRRANFGRLMPAGGELPFPQLVEVPVLSEEDFQPPMPDVEGDAQFDVPMPAEEEAQLFHQCMAFLNDRGIDSEGLVDALNTLSQCGCRDENFPDFCQNITSENFARFVNQLSEEQNINFSYCFNHFPAIYVGLLIYYLMEHPEGRAEIYDALNRYGCGSFVDRLTLTFAQQQPLMPAEEVEAQFDVPIPDAEEDFQPPVSDEVPMLGEDLETSEDELPNPIYDESEEARMLNQGIIFLDERIVSGTIEAGNNTLSAYENVGMFLHILDNDGNFMEFLNQLSQDLNTDFSYLYQNYGSDISIGLLIYYLMEHPEARERMYTAFNERGLGSFAGWLQSNFAQPQQ